MTEKKVTVRGWPAVLLFMWIGFSSALTVVNIVKWVLT